MASISFSTGRRDGSDVLSFVPIVDGIALLEKVDDFERAHDMNGSCYSGLSPSFAKFGTAREHYYARSEIGRRGGKVPLLGCTCGEWGCWPLLARVVVDQNSVTWREFEQPSRRE